MPNLILHKINPRFRNLMDLLLLSDRMDLDLSEFNDLLKLDYNNNLNYFFDKLLMSTSIFWENNDHFWFNRLSFLLSLNDFKINKCIEQLFDDNIASLISVNNEINPKYDIHCEQYIQFCKVKLSRGENLNWFKQYLINNLSARTNVDKLIKTINIFIPFVFKDLEDYASYLLKKTKISASDLSVIFALEKRGIMTDKNLIADLAIKIIIEKWYTSNSKNCLALILSKPDFLTLVKDKYKPEFKNNLLFIHDKYYAHDFEKNHLIYFKNLIKLDTSITDELVSIYIDKICDRHQHHNRANADRFIKLINNIPEVCAKKILVFLSHRGRMKEIKYLLEDLPNLRKFSAFT